VLVERVNEEKFKLRTAYLVYRNGSLIKTTDGIVQFFFDKKTAKEFIRLLKIQK